MSSLAGSLSKTFNFAAKAALLVGSFVIGSYLGSMFFDPFFFPIIHDPSNIMGQALRGFMTDHFGAVHQWMGLSGHGGLLNMDWVQNLMGLKPYIAAATPAVVPGGLGVDEVISSLSQ